MKFNIEQFYKDMTAKKDSELRAYFNPSAIICWHDSNEQFTLDEYIKVNCAFPSSWTATIERVEQYAKGLIVTAQHDNAQEKISVKHVAFIELNTDGKITRFDEYYVAMEEVPKWRSEMGLGRPINKEEL